MYEQHYGISAKPFQLSPDPKFFFASKKHKQALSYLQYGLEQGEGFIVITGPIGSGKTTIARNLLESIFDTDIDAIQIVSSNLTPEDLLLVIAKSYQLNLPSHSKADVLQAIEQHLQYLHNHGKRALLLVDEAQNLPVETVEELRMLSNFQQDNKPLLQSFLLGQEELKGIIQSPNMEQFRQRIIASCHLRSLTTEELTEYILHRLSLVGLEQENFIQTDCFKLINQISEGIPRKINQLMDRVLLYGFLNDLKQFTLHDVQAVIEEMSDELSASIEVKPNDTVALTSASSGKNPNTANEFSNIVSNLTELEEFLLDNISQKVKLNRYLDKMIKQKNIALANLEFGMDDDPD